MKLKELKPLVGRGIKKDRYWVERNGSAYIRLTDGSLKPMAAFKRRNGYYDYGITVNGKQKRIQAGRVTANAWHSLRITGKKVSAIVTHHINGNLTDNCMENIRVMTHQKHMNQHLGVAVELTSRYGVVRRYTSISDAARDLGCSYGGVYAVIKGYTRSVRGYSVRVM